jgi:Fur family ferric uptake transcriptional regulator
MPGYDLHVKPDAWIAQTRTALDEAGFRKGGAREAVVELLSGQSCAITAQEIDARLNNSPSARSVGRASVYRALEQLTQLKLVTRVDVGDGIARYEPNRPHGEHHHHHLVCDKCGQIQPFEDAQLEQAIDKLSQRLDFRVAEHDVVLRGNCEACRN